MRKGLGFDMVGSGGGEVVVVFWGGGSLVAWGKFGGKFGVKA